MARQKQGIDFSSEASDMRAKVEEWKKTKPERNKMVSGALGSEIRKKNQAKYDAALAAWKSKDPRNQSNASTPTPKSTPTAAPNKQATVTPANKEATKIANDVKSVAKKNSTPKRAVLKDKVRGSARIGFKTRPGGQRKKK